jgi:hypothetical protein
LIMLLSLYPTELIMISRFSHRFGKRHPLWSLQWTIAICGGITVREEVEVCGEKFTGGNLNAAVNVRKHGTRRGFSRQAMISLGLPSAVGNILEPRQP